MFWYDSKNVGDALSPIIVSHFFQKDVSLAKRNETGKLLGIGSVMKALREGDTVWGTGIMREDDKFPMAPKCKFLAVRGKLTEKILGIDVGVYGDPALLLPLMYNPEVEQKYDVGYVPHYVDKPIFKGFKGKVIDIEQDWRGFVREIKQCKKIVSSSLHGLIIAEAYGLQAEWRVYSDKVLGKGFKFRDYLSATDRESFDEPLDKSKLKSIQDSLIKAIQGADV